MRSLIHIGDLVVLEGDLILSVMHRKPTVYEPNVLVRLRDFRPTIAMVDNGTATAPCSSTSSHADSLTENVSQVIAEAVSAVENVLSECPPR